MDWKTQILEQLDRGFTKSDIENLVGLPKNNLSGVLKGDRHFSKKNILKIERWLASEKPDPLEIVTKSAKSTPLGKEVLKQMQGVQSSISVRNISPKGDVLSTHKLDTSNKPERLKGESSIEYKLRMAELNESKNQ